MILFCFWGIYQSGIGEKWEKYLFQNICINTSITLIGGVVGIYAALFAFFPIIVSYLRNRCIFFDPYELVIIKINIFLVICSVVLAVTYFVLNIMKVTSDCLCIFAGMWVLLIIAIVIIYIACIFIVPLIIEKIILSKLELLGKRIYITPNKKWWRSNVIKLIDKLLNSYTKALKKIEFNKIESIEFASSLSSKNENIILAKKRLLKICAIVVGILILFGVEFSEALTPFQKIEYLFLTLLSALPIAIPIINKEIIEENYAYINNLGCSFSTWGYYIKLNNMKECIYFPAYGFSFSKYHCVMMNLKRIACFFNLSIKMKYEDTECIDDIEIECLCDYITDSFYRNEYTAGMLIPVLICISLSENREKSRQFVKEMLSQVSIDKKERDISIDFSLEVLRNIKGNDKVFKRGKYKMEMLDLF